MPVFDEQDNSLVQFRAMLRNRNLKPQVGDFVVRKDGHYKRIAYLWGDEAIQLADGGSFYLCDTGDASYSGSLDPGIIQRRSKIGSAEHDGRRVRPLPGVSSLAPSFSRKEPTMIVVWNYNAEQIYGFRDLDAYKQFARNHAQTSMHGVWDDYVYDVGEGGEATDDNLLDLSDFNTSLMTKIASNVQ